MRTIFFTACLLLSFAISAQFPSGRYVDHVFQATQSILDVKYGSAPKWTVPYNNTDLMMDIYLPQDDTLTKRPLVIFAHAGGFLNGDKQVDDMVALCDSFAKKGYVTATINYRMGFNPLDGESAERAVYRGVQDGKAAVRYFKEYQDTYRIDTNYVFFGGMSAGGYMSLFVGYMDKESDRPQSTYGGGLVNNLGCLDCAGNSYNVSSKVRGILSYWGAVQDTTMIELGEAPALLMHGVNDPTVPFDYGHAFGLTTLPATYGSYYINERMNNIGLYHEYYTSNSNLHMLDGSDNGTFPPSGPNAFWYDTLLPRTTEFLYKIIRPNPLRISPENLAVCEREEFNLSVLPDEQTTHQWIYNSSAITLLDNSENAMFKAIQNGTYQIGYVETNHLLAISDTLWFSIEVRNSPNLELTTSEEDICIGKSVELTVTGADSYAWNEGLSSESSHTVFPEVTTTYEVIGQNANGCSDTTSIQIVVNDCVATTEVLENQLLIYPNPTSDYLTIENSVSNGFNQFVLLDVTGKEILQGKLANNHFMMDLKGMSEGIYVIQLIGEGGLNSYQIQIEK